MKFFKVSVLLSAYILLWGVNSFAFSVPTIDSVNQVPYKELNTHIIPLVQIDGALISIEDLMSAVSDVHK
jgi:hypothetical protein